MLCLPRPRSSNVTLPTDRRIDRVPLAMGRTTHADMMRTEEHRPVRLSEYRPPDWLVETVDLDVKLHPTQTPVRATLKLKPNPAAGAPAPLVLDGDGLTLVSLKIDGAPVAEGCLCRDARTASPSRSRRTGRSRWRSRRWSIRRPTPSSPGSTGRAATTARNARPRASAASPIIPDRPDVMAVFTTRIEADKAEAPVLLANGNLTRERRPARRPAFRGLARSVAEARLSVRAGRRQARPHRGQLRHHVGPQGRAPHLCRARQGGSRRLRHGFAEALDALGRGGVRPRIRSRHLHDRRRVRLQHGRDGEQGPQRLQRQVRAGHARDRDRQRLRRDRSHHRARVFPQLDRQPHHLPRLVPALPEGRPDGLSRPGVHRRPALARRRRGSATCAACARSSSSRTPAPSPIRCGRSSIARSTTSTPRPSTRRAPRWCA